MTRHTVRIDAGPPGSPYPQAVLRCDQGDYLAYLPRHQSLAQAAGRAYLHVAAVEKRHARVLPPPAEPGRPGRWARLLGRPGPATPEALAAARARVQRERTAAL